MPRRADSCARDRTARALTRPALALFFGGGARSTAGFWVGDYERASARERTRGPACRRREIAHRTKETVVLWFKVDDSHYVFWRAALRFSAGKRGEPRSAVYARSLPSSPLELGAICRPPPVLLSRGIMPRLASASPFSAEKKSARDEKRAAADGVDPSFHSVASRRLPGGGSSVGFPPVSACPATSGAFFLPSPGASEAFGQVLNGV